VWSEHPNISSVSREDPGPAGSLSDPGKRKLGMRTSQCEAIVLAVRDYSEADKIVTFFTREHGKIGSIAKSAKKSSKRFGGALEVFAHLRLHMVLKETLSRLDGVDLVTIFPHIREGLPKIAHAGYACELVSRLLPEAQPNVRLYRLLLSYLEHLDSAPAIEDDRRFFEVNLLNILGYRIPLESCSQCGVPLESVAEPYYSLPSVEFLCSRCTRSGLKISPGTLSLLEASMHTGRFGKIRFTGDALQQAGEILDSSIASHLNTPLRSLAFLHEISRVEGRYFQQPETTNNP
jgi:DNA repair protein RecO (recombination protein O)